MKEIILKPTDKKLLAHLYYNSREPATKTAKTLKISREQIVYRIKKFESQGIIKGYVPIVNYSRLGHHLITLILFRLTKQSHLEIFKEELRKNKNRITTVEVMVRYDIGVLFVFKDEKQRNDCISEILQKNNTEISDFKIIEPYFSEFFPLKFLGISQTQPQIFHEYKSKEYKLDDKEKKILSALNKNANMRLIDIAKKTNLSAELVLHKLKKLQGENVLISTRAYFDMEKIGYFYSIIFINLHNFSPYNQEKLRKFAKDSKCVDSFMLMLGNPNCYMQIVHRDMLEIHKILNSFKHEFKNEQFSIEIIPLKNEGEDVNLLPFL